MVMISSNVSRITGQSALRGSQLPMVMAGFPEFAYNDSLQPLEFVDHPHQRLHQHQSLLDILAHRLPNQATVPNRPDVDISDAIGHYLLDIEVPGIKDPNSISCQFTSWRCLIVTGTTIRPEHPLEAARVNNGHKEAHDANGFGKLERQDWPNGSGTDKWHAEVAADLPPYLLSGERRIGSFRRTFNFPEDVNMQKLSAVLEAGLLRIKLPKKHHDAMAGIGKVKIEAVV